MICNIFYFCLVARSQNSHATVLFKQFATHAVIYVRAEGFLERKNLGTCHVVVNCHECHVVVNCHECHGTPNPKFHFGLLLFHLAQGLTVPQQILPVTLKSAKKSLKMYWLHLKNCSLVYLKAKIEEKLNLPIFWN